MTLSHERGLDLAISWGAPVVLYVIPLSGRVAGTSLLFFPECKHRSCKTLHHARQVRFVHRCHIEPAQVQVERN